MTRRYNYPTNVLTLQKSFLLLATSIKDVFYQTGCYPTDLYTQKHIYAQNGIALLKKQNKKRIFMTNIKKNR